MARMIRQRGRLPLLPLFHAAMPWEVVGSLGGSRGYALSMLAVTWFRLHLSFNYGTPYVYFPKVSDQEAIAAQKPGPNQSGDWAFEKQPHVVAIGGTQKIDLSRTRLTAPPHVLRTWTSTCVLLGLTAPLCNWYHAMLSTI